MTSPRPILTPFDCKDKRLKMRITLRNLAKAALVDQRRLAEFEAGTYEFEPWALQRLRRQLCPWEEDDDARD